MEERIVYKAENGIIHKTELGVYLRRIPKDDSVPYPSENVRYHFVRNGVSLQRLLKFLYENKIDYRQLRAIHNKGARMIFNNEIVKPIFIGTALHGSCIYIKCKNTEYCDVFRMSLSEFNKIERESLYLINTAVIAKRDKIDNDIMRFCRRLKTKVYIKEDCTKEVRQTIKNTKNVIKLKRIKELMKRVHNEAGINQ